MLAHGRLVAVALTALLVSGCAIGRGGSLAGRFVEPGKPAVPPGGLPPGGSPAHDDRPTKQLPTPAPPPKTLAVSVESSDRRLAAALMMEGVFPTPEHHLQVALEYKRLGILDTAAARMALAVKKAPRYADAHEALARVWRDTGFPAWGLGSAYRAVYFAPQSAGAQNTLGTLLVALGRLDAARSVYARALTLDPEAAWAENNLCHLEFRAGRFEQARTWCEAAIRMAPAFKAAHNNLGLVLAATGDLAGARQEFLAAGDLASALYNIGIVRLAEGEYRSAAEAFEEAIRQRPDFTEAKSRAHVARLRLMAGE